VRPGRSFEFLQNPTTRDEDNFYVLSSETTNDQECIVCKSIGAVFTPDQCSMNKQGINHPMCGNCPTRLQTCPLCRRPLHVLRRIPPSIPRMFYFRVLHLHITYHLFLYLVTPLQTINDNLSRDEENEMDASAFGALEDLYHYLDRFRQIHYDDITRADRVCGTAYIRGVADRIECRGNITN